MAGMKDFGLRFLVSLVSSVIAFHLAFRQWMAFFLRIHHERNLGVAAALAIQSYAVGYCAAIICFILVFIVMGLKFPFLRPKSSDH